MPSSKAAKRRARHYLERTPNTSDSDSEGTHDVLTQLTTTTRTPSPLRNPTMATPRVRLLVASIGNPAPYLGTLHSAGHTVLAALSAALSHTPPTKSRSHGNGHLSSSSSESHPYTLWRSPSLMNVSGAALSIAYKQFQRDCAMSGEFPRLVVVHDELELGLGEVKVKSGANSPKGHNGLKSIRDRMPGVEYTRVGVGIGRPVGREPDVVAAYVLRKMSGAEKAKVEGCVGKVLAELERLAV